MSWIKYLFTFVSTAAATATAPQVHRCAVEDPSEEQRRAVHADIATHVNFTNAAAQADIAIRTYVHVVTTQAKQYAYPISMIRDQRDLLNKVFRKFGISFNFISIDYTVDDTWARSSQGTAANRAMRNFLQRELNAYTTLNLYFLSNLGAENAESLLGICTFPVANPTADQRLLDGCLNGADTLPGGASQRFGLGYTAAHEIGHWLNLFHTFSGNNCAGYGDGISDTAAEHTATSGCPTNKDTCPDYPGVDPIHNIMDYSDDNCLVNFTDGQAQFAVGAYNRYRVPASTTTSGSP